MMTRCPSRPSMRVTACYRDWSQPRCDVMFAPAFEPAPASGIGPPCRRDSPGLSESQAPGLVPGLAGGSVVPGTLKP
eukprot:2673290-Rhodomonas_salina.1